MSSPQRQNSLSTKSVTALVSAAFTLGLVSMGALVTAFDVLFYILS